MKKLTIDFETRSAAPIKKVGAAAYAQHPTTEVICLALKWEDQEPRIWYSPEFLKVIDTNTAGRQLLSFLTGAQVMEAMEEADLIEAHNAQFEYFIWKYVMPKYGFPMFDARKLRCSAAKAAMYGLPRDLSGACAAAGVRQQKDMEGSRLMMRLCQPRKALKEDKLRDADWETRLYWRGTPSEFVRLGEYCMQDVRAEESLSDALPDLPGKEQRLWYLDLLINDRGIRVDAPAAQAILTCVEAHASQMTKEFQTMTGLSSPRQRDALLNHLISIGVQMEGLTAKDVADALSDAAEGTQAKRILEIRQSLSKSSTAKYNAFLATRGDGDRIRGCFMYHGAGTGRWSGRLIQPQNFPRGEFSDIDNCIKLFEQGNLRAVNDLYGDPMVAASTCLRGMLIPDAGKDFICADYSSIEGRVLAWIAGEETALDVYRKGRDPYKVAASAIYHTKYEDVTKPQRQIGKVAELACIAEGQKVLTDKGLVPIEEVTTDHLVWDGLEWVSHDGVVCKGKKEVVEYAGLIATTDHLVWVEGKPEPVYFGYAAASGAHLIQTGDGGNPIRMDRDHISGSRESETQELAKHIGEVSVYDIVNAGPRHRFTVSGKLVHNCGYQGGLGAYSAMASVYGITLPEAEIQQIVDNWRNARPLTVNLWHELEHACRMAIRNPGQAYQYRGVKFIVRKQMLAVRIPSGRCLWYCRPRLEAKDMKWGETKTVIAFDGVNSVTRKWGTQYLYGGLLAENVTQATARDILANGLFNAEEAGYPIVMHVHDEAVAEVPEGYGSVEEFEKLLCELPDWAPDLPLKAEGWRGKRYKK